MRQLAQIDINGNFLDGTGKVPIPVKVPEPPKPVQIVPSSTKVVIRTEETIPTNDVFYPEYLNRVEREKLDYMLELHNSGIGIETVLKRARRVFRTNAA